MVPASGVGGKRIAVLGLGRTGLTAAASLAAGGAEIAGWDEAADARDGAREAGVPLMDLSAEGAWEGIDCLVVSPGVQHLYPEPNRMVLAAADAGVPIDNDIGVFFKSVRPDAGEGRGPVIVAVTGSNGKSTTSALIHHTLTHSGRAAQIAGNIGQGVLGIDPPGDGEIVVLEASSYQCDVASVLDPDIAVFLNLTPDHLGRHGGLGGYFSAKRRLFGGRSLRRAVIGVDDNESRFLASQIAARTEPGTTVRVSAARDSAGRPPSVRVRDGGIAASIGGPEVRVDLDGIRALTGVHNRQNACAATAVCLGCGLDAAAVEAGFRTFSGLPHRTQIVGEYGGVLCVNDSKSTNAESAAMALKAFRNIRWIAGGLGKESGLAPLSDCLENVVKAYLIGHSAREFALQLGGAPYAICRTMEDAVSLAASDAEPGDTVLLAPAAASFDQYPDFEARGLHFIEEVRKRFRS